MSWAIGAVTGLALAEAILWLAVRWLKPGFQWLVTRADIAPEIDEGLVREHLARGFDPELGWVRRPRTRGQDRTPNGVVNFAIDGRGCRRSPGFENRPARVAVFGDSFAFCRLVEDDETWPHQLARLLDASVLNFGVGNYGLDQACLRMERELPRLACRVAVICVVPETMARIHSYWKHYFEYGNVLAFKPRFTLADGRLVHHAPAVRRREDYRTYRSRLAEIQRLDPFYGGKFRKDIIAFPHLWAVARRARRHVPIVWHLLLGRLLGRKEAARKRAFGIVLRENVRTVARLYAEEQPRQLFEALLCRVREQARRCGAEPILAVVPQPVDLARRERGFDDYGAFFADMAGVLEVVDLTEAFLAQGDWRRLYVEGPLGPHVNARGNRLIAEALAPRIRPLLAGEPTPARSASLAARANGAL